MGLWRHIKSSILSAGSSCGGIEVQSKVRRFAFHKNHSGFVWMMYWKAAKGGEGSTSEATAGEEAREKAHLTYTGKED